ncbi:hypothetical protein Tco_1445715 [Tanacetum coccineum]
MSKIYNLCTDLIEFAYMALPPRDQRHQYLRFEGLQYTDADIADFETRLAKIYKREVHRVQVFDFGGLTELMDEGLRGRMLMKHKDVQGLSVFTSRAWRRLFEIRGPLVHELILEFFSTFRFREGVLNLDTDGALQGDETLSWSLILGSSSVRDPMPESYATGSSLVALLGGVRHLKKVTVTDLFYLRGMDVGSVNVPYLLARYLRLFASGKKQCAMIFGDLPVIDMGELVRLQICMELDDTWA